MEIGTQVTPPKLQLTSPAFDDNGFIPEDYTCDGTDISPPLSISGVAVEAESLVLVVDDPDAPGGSFIHWILYNINPQILEIPQDTIPADAMEGVNTYGNVGYGGPCPPAGTHRYVFTLYAIAKTLHFENPPSIAELEKSIEGEIIDSTELLGRYTRAI